MKSDESLNLRYLLSRGHNLCTDIKDYTEAQVFFMVLAEEMELGVEEPQKSPLSISSSDEPNEIKRKFKLWKGGLFKHDNS